VIRPARPAALLALAALALPPATARADGDPASDALVTGDVYFPYAPPISAPVSRRLTRVVRETARSGRLVRVAVIGTPIDFGAAAALLAGAGIARRG
jgi:hypothetical protein